MLGYFDTELSEYTPAPPKGGSKNYTEKGGRFILTPWRNKPSKTYKERGGS